MLEENTIQSILALKHNIQHLAMHEPHAKWSDGTVTVYYYLGTDDTS